MVGLGSAQVTLGQKQYSCFLSHLDFLSRAMLMLDHGLSYLVGSCIAGLLSSIHSSVQFSSIIYMLCMW